MTVEKVSDVFATHLPERLKSKPNLAENVNATYKFDINGDGGGVWCLDLTKAGGEIRPGDGEAQCILTIKAADFIDMINGRLNPQAAFMTGKLRIAGDVGLALKLGSILG